LGALLLFGDYPVIAFTVHAHSQAECDRDLDASLKRDKPGDWVSFDANTREEQ
jgi:hypothetical protein